MPKTDTYHHGNLHRSLLQEAAREVRKNGWVDLNMRALARKCDVSHTAVYRHFKDKDELLAEIAVGGFAKLNKELRQASEPVLSGHHRDQQQAFQSLAEQLVSIYVNFACANPRLFALMYAPELSDRASFPELLASASTAFNLTRSFIEWGQGTGTVRDGPSSQFAVAAFTAAHGLATLMSNGFLRLPQVNAVTREGFIQATAGQILSYLAPAHSIDAARTFSPAQS